MFVIRQPKGLGIGWSALAGAGVALATGVIHPGDIPVVWHIVWDATFTFVALIVISLLLDEAGFFHWAALHIARWGGGRGRRLFPLVILLGAAIAVSVAWLAPHRAWLTRLHRALARVRELGTPPVDPHRLRSALVELHEAHDVAAGEVQVGKLPTEELLDVSQHAYRLLDGRSPVRD